MPPSGVQESAAPLVSTKTARSGGPDRQAQLNYLECLRACRGRKAEAQRDAKVYKWDLQSWRAADEHFAAEEQAIMELCDDDVRAGIDEYVVKRDKDMLRFAAQRLPEYQKTQRVDHKHSGAVGVYAMTPEERAQLIRASNAAIEVEFERE